MKWIIINQHILHILNHHIINYWLVWHERSKNWVIPHAFKKFNTGHHVWANRSSPINHTSVINLAMEPHQRDNYKLTQIIESESPHKQVLTGIIWKFKKLSGTTWLQKMQHMSTLVCIQVIINISHMFNPLVDETTWRE